MYSKVMSGAIHGIDSYLVQVEVDTAQAMPGFDMVGSLGSEVREARERVRVVLKNAAIQVPAIRITVNLSPADVRKEGTAFDLPIAIGVLVSLGYIPQEYVEQMLILGELGLDGDIKPVRGVLPIVLEAQKAGLHTCIVPQANVNEAGVVQGTDIIGATDIRQILEYLTKAPEQRNEFIPPARIDVKQLFEQEAAGDTPDFEDISGQKTVRRAATVAAAGFHHLLLIGPPGSGKTMIAKRIPSILPPLSMEESLEVSKIYSVSGLLNAEHALITRRPFMNPHHTISEHALAGGGRIPRPGVISLAHRAVLFLDELPEFRRDVIEILRQPMEDKEVHIARSYGTFSYPADFMLVAAMNPCPCGYYPDRNRCHCTSFEVKRYISRISGPILDRIDICVEAPKIEITELSGKSIENESSTAIRRRVMKAQERQKERFQGTGMRFNADMNSSDIRKYCPLGVKEQSLLEQIFTSMNLSARAYHKTIRIARTIADLEDCDEIREEHISEAAFYRMTDGKYWEN